MNLYHSLLTIISVAKHNFTCIFHANVNIIKFFKETDQLLPIVMLIFMATSDGKCVSVQFSWKI